MGRIVHSIMDAFVFVLLCRFRGGVPSFRNAYDFSNALLGFLLRVSQRANWMAHSLQGNSNELACALSWYSKAAWCTIIYRSSTGKINKYWSMFLGAHMNALCLAVFRIAVLIMRLTPCTEVLLRAAVKMDVSLTCFSPGVSLPHFVAQVFL